jgi:hypothetical protein
VRSVSRGVRGVVRRCLAAGLVEGKNLAVDGTIVGANASRQGRVPRERLQEAAQVSRTVREYLAELEQATQSPAQRWFRLPIQMRFTRL